MNGKHLLLCLSFALCLSIGIVLALYQKEQDTLRGYLYFFDIGQGDAAFINLPDNIDVLIDTGFDNRVVRKLHQYDLVEDKSIEYVIISHPHMDHDGGLSYLKDYFEIKHVVYFSLSRDYDPELPWVHIDDASGFDDFPFRYLYPNGFTPPDANPNNASLVLAHESEGVDILFTGDIERDVETLLCESGDLFDIDFLKIAHHGSSSSSSPCFLEHTRPEFAVISAGEENSYGHPHFRTLDLLRRRGTQMLRTDTMGDIIIDISGGLINVSTHKSP